MADPASLPRPRALIFDLDDTLTDRRRSVNAYAARFLSEFAPRLAPASLPGVAETEARLNRADGAGYNRERPRDIVAAFEWTAPPRPEEIDAHWVHHFPGCSVPRSGMRRALDELARRGIDVGLVTNGEGPVQRAKLGVLGIEGSIRHVTISAEVGCEKPDPAIFDSCLRGLGCSANEAWFVGDHPEKDVGGASAFGLAAIWVRASHAWPAGLEPPERSLEDLAELLPLLEAAESRS